MKTVLCFTFFLLTTVLCANAQVQNSGWLINFNTFKLNDKWSAYGELQLRSSDKWANMQTIILRPGINYHFNKSLMVSAGYGYIANRRNIGDAYGYLPEHRLWQQVQYSFKIKNIAISHRLRFEERYLPNATLVNNEVKREGFSNAYRLRYFNRNLVPLTKKQTFTKGMFATIQDEIFVNTGDGSAVNGKFFDQNRLYLALGYRISSKVDIDAGYMNQYVGGRTSDVNNHVIQLVVYKRL